MTILLVNLFGIPASWEVIVNNSNQKLKTLTLEEAAVYLNMSPGSLRRKAFSGQIPGAKPGKRWCFYEDDLAQYLRSLYASPATVSLAYPNRRNQCHSTKEKRVVDYYPPQWSKNTKINWDF